MAQNPRFSWRRGVVLLAFTATITLAQGSWQGTQLIATPKDDWAMDIQMGQSGELGIVGYTLGSLGLQTPVGERDAFITVPDSSGKRLWWQQYGSPSEDDERRKVITDMDGNIFVVGLTEGDGDAQSAQGDYDSYVMKFSPAGQKL